MGFLTQTVGAVVNLVENATGNQGSGTGDWTEQQAADAEAAAQGAVDAVSDVASDCGDFAQVMSQHLETRLGAWLTGGIASSGIPAPNRIDLAILWGLTKDVLQLTANKLDTKAGNWVPAPVVAGARRLAGTAARGPAAVWGEVKTEIGGADLLQKVRHWGDKMGTRADDAAPAKAIIHLAQRADAERAKLVIELRLAWLGIKAGLRDSVPVGHSFQLQRAYSRSAEGVELRRITTALLGAAQSGTAQIGPDAARHIAAAAAAAARGSALHSELLLWLAAIRRLAARSRASKRR